MGIICITDLEAHLFCIELGIQKGPTCPIAIGCHMHSWPEKVGELLASMDYYATCHYLDNLRYIPQVVTWAVYGVFAIRTCGCMVLKMVLDGTGCHVYLIHEGSLLSLGPAIEHVSNRHNASPCCIHFTSDIVHCIIMFVLFYCH